ncbi:MAG: type IV pilus modification PilV family protein [Opitutales bacterium]
MKMHNNSGEKKSVGFALIEVLIIFVIVVLLAVMTVPVFKKMNELSKDDSSPSVTPVPIEEQGMPK